MTDQRSTHPDPTRALHRGARKSAVEEQRRERRRTALALLGGAASVFALLVVGGALSLGLGVVAFAAVAATVEVFLWTARAAPAATPSVTDAAGDVAVAGGPAPETVFAAGRAVFDLWPDPALLVSADERIDAANAAARGAFQLPAAPSRLTAAVREPAVLEAVRETLAHGRAATTAFMMIAPQERHFRVFVAPMDSGRGDASVSGERNALVVFHDSTAERRAERARLDFLANASHELRTPLTSLAGFIETLRGRARDDAEARDRFLTIMEAQTARMRRLINDLLALSRAELNEHVPPIGVARLEAVAGDVADGLGPVARAAGVALACETGAAAPVIGDRDQLIQIAQNLVDNAVKYSSPGDEVRVVVGVTPGPQAVEPARLEPGGAPRLTLVSAPECAHGFAWLAVRDRGPGIAREHLPRLGERFFRCDEPGSSGRGREGTGLGLAIVKRLVSRHRGGLTVASSPQDGATFTVFIPSAGPEAEPAPPADAQPGVAAGAGDDAPSA